MNDNDKTVKANSVPPMSSGTHEQGGPLLETGMMQPPKTPGTLGMIGKYQVVRILGEGGMGQVLLAREPVTDALVAVKIIKPEFLKKEWAVHRFLTEARHMFKMSHPSIIRVHEVSDRPEGPYFVMPFMAGGSLAQKIKPGETLPSDTIQPLARQVAEALQYAHGRGIIHRDLKTSNILLDPEGRAYLCDFGLLRTVFNDSMVDVTKPQVEGTVPYLSPAIAGGKAEDTRCDIYAFGCLLYEMLTGQPPYQGPTVDAILKQIQAGPPQPIRQLNPTAPARLVAVAEHAMGRELRDRYSTMADVINDLDRAAQGKEPFGPHGRVDGSHLRRNLLAALGIVALLALAAFGLSKLPGGKDGSLAATPQDQFTWTNNNGAITITKYTGPGGAVTIPSKINGVPVTCIGDNAFSDCADLTRVTIPNGVTTINGWAFQLCQKLKNVRIPASVKNIGDASFAGCNGMTSIDVDADNPNFSSMDGVLFNKDRTCLVSYAGGKAVRYVIPNTATSIGSWAFAQCYNIVGVTIPDSVTNIGPGAFWWCHGLTNVAIPGSVTTIGCRAFQGCGELTSVVIPDGVTTLDRQMFKNCGKLTSVTLPANLTNINNDAFLSCANLTRMTIPANVSSIGDTTFGNCSALTEVCFKGNVPSLGAETFQGANKATIYYLPNTTGWGKEFGGLPTAPWNPQANNAASPAATAQTPFTCTTNNGAITITKYTGPGGAVSIPSTINGLPVTSIGDNAFQGSSLTSVSFPNSVTSIADKAFENCAGLTNVAIPQGITSIGTSAFGGCTSLTNVTIPNTVTSIGYKAFQVCSRLTSVKIPASVTNIGVQPFCSCGGLNAILVDTGNPAYSSSADGVLFDKKKTRLVQYPGGKAGSYMIPDSVTSIRDVPFADCTKLTSVTIPNTVPSISDWAFFRCTGLTSVTIPANVTNIGDWAFCDCTGLASVTIPNSVTSIGQSAFEGCTSLSNVTIPNRCTHIGNWAFKRTSLTSITIPSGVASLGVATFQYCVNLTSVMLPQSVTNIGDHPFACCSGLNSIMVDVGNPAYSSSADGVLFNKEKTCLINYPGGKAGHYEIPSGVTRIAKGAISGCPYLSSVTIPESVTMIEASAFSGCESLARIYFKGNAPWLGQDVFAGLKKATIYHLPEAKGWGPEFGGLPTAPWNPAAK